MTTHPGRRPGILPVEVVVSRSSETARFSKVRNFGIAAHIDAGKTTLTERILYYTGVSHKIGEVHEGTAVMDYTPEERSRGITITAAVTHCEWKGYHLHLIDTPGHVDFTIEVERSMRVLDGMIIVLDAVKGVEPQTETVWRQAQRYKVPRILFVNKVDRPGADFENALKTVAKRLGGRPVPIVIPVTDDDHRGVVDVVGRRWLTFEGERGKEVHVHEIPEDVRPLASRHREFLIESLADFDDDIAEAYLAGESIEDERIRAVLRRATIEGAVQPALGGAALRDFGIQPVLDAVIDCLPGPLEVPPLVGENPRTGEKVEIRLDAKEPLVALAFKVQMFNGRRHVYLKLYRGRLSGGTVVLNASRDQNERIARIFNMRADRREALDTAVAGDIIVAAGLRHASTGETLCDPEHPIVLEPIRSYEPVMALAVEALRTGDEDKLMDALSRMLEEDPTLRLVEDSDTGQRLLYGMGELHLNVVLDRMQREYNVQVRTGRPRVVYRESISTEARGEGRVDRALEKGGHHRARVVVQVHPASLDEEVQVSGLGVRVLPEEVSLTQEQRGWLLETIAQEAQTGPLQGYPMIGARIELDEVELFGAESPEVALREAAARATRAALHSADPQLLAPIMNVVIETPTESVGAVMGDLQARGGSVLGMDGAEGMTQIRAECAMEKLFGYAGDLRNITQGRGTFTLTFARLDRVSSSSG